MDKSITYMANAQNLIDNFWATKKSFEAELKGLIEKNGAITLENSLNLNFGIGNDVVRTIVIGDGDNVLLWGENNLVYYHLTDIELEDFYKLCTELGM